MTTLATAVCGARFFPRPEAPQLKGSFKMSHLHYVMDLYSPKITGRVAFGVRSSASLLEVTKRHLRNAGVSTAGRNPTITIFAQSGGRLGPRID